MRDAWNSPSSHLYINKFAPSHYDSLSWVYGISSNVVLDGYYLMFLSRIGYVCYKKSLILEISLYSTYLFAYSVREYFLISYLLII